MIAHLDIGMTRSGAILGQANGSLAVAASPTTS